MMNKPTVANKSVRDILHRNIMRSARSTNTTTREEENLEREKGKEPQVGSTFNLARTYISN